MKKMILISSLLLLSGCGYLDSEPPAGKTEGYVHEPTQQSEQVEQVESSESVESVEKTTEVEVVEEEEVEEVKVGMAIFVPDREKMVSLPIVVAEETPAYTEEELAYWNGLAAEYGLLPYDGVSDFNQFVANVQLAINNAQQSVVEEPVYEEPVYEEPVYEEPVYEEPESSYEEPSSEVPSAPEEPSLPDESANDVSSYSQRTDHFNNNSSVLDESE